YQPKCTTNSYGGCYDAGRPTGCADLDRSDCVEAVGCTWQDPDGTRGTVEYGTCEGTATSCSDITDETTCTAQPSYAGLGSSPCQWYAYDVGGHCSDVSSAAPDCSSFSGLPASSTDQHYLHPATQKYACSRRAGCTWKPSKTP